ncbi:SIS domain-containing protein [Endozoicomonas lisbonensis]
MSTYLTFDESYLRDIYGEHTAKEITHQPAMWRQAFNNIETIRGEIDAFLAPVMKKDNVRVVLTGAGTSAFAGKTLAPHLTKVTGRRFDAVSTTDIVAAPGEYLGEQVPTLVISFARSGNSPESVATVDLADQVLNDCYHLVLTCNPEGQLAKAAQTKKNMFCLLMPEGTNDKSFAMTSSFTSMMLSALCIFDPSEGLANSVESICTNTEQLIAEKAAEMKALAAKACERVVFLGSGSFQGLAQESALKLLELTAGKVVAIHDSPLGFRHGPKSVVNDKTIIFNFMSNDRYTRQYDQDLLAEIRQDNQAMHIVALSDGADEQVMSGNVICTETQAGNENVWLSFPFIALAQTFSFFKSVQLNITPDNPCPTGEVNRVVQGVTIHPYNKK